MSMGVQWGHKTVIITLRAPRSSQQVSLALILFNLLVQFSDKLLLKVNMNSFVTITVVVGVVSMLSPTFAAIGGRPPMMGGPHGPVGGPNKGPKLQPIFCTMDSLIFYQDCRMCLCPKPNRPAKCVKKSCDLRTKDSGQCPTVVLKMDDSKLCPNSPMASCKVDVDCPGNQLCCFDFCNGATCMNPVPLDIISGIPTHNGRGYQ